MREVSMQKYYDAYDHVIRLRNDEIRERGIRRPAIQNYMRSGSKHQKNGFQRMDMCRKALEALDRKGWQRSFHQRLFHDHFIRACARIFWKREPEGTFARDHQSILEINGWDHLSQEVLVSTPRRFAGLLWWNITCLAHLVFLFLLVSDGLSTLAASAPT